MTTSQTPPKAPEEPPGSDQGRFGRMLRAASRSSLPRQHSLRWSFNWAFEGIVYVVRTQRNMQIHAAAAVFVLVRTSTYVDVLSTFSSGGAKM